MAADGYRPVDLGDGGEEARRALWAMACGLLALVDDDPNPRVLPQRGESAWLHELAARHASGEVATAELVALVQLHYLDERDQAHLAEARADELVARIVVLVEGGRPALSPAGLIAVRDALGLGPFPSEGEGESDRPRASGSCPESDDPASRFRGAEVNEPEAILSGRRVRYVAPSIVEDVIAQALIRFKGMIDAPEPQASRMLGLALLDLVVALWRARPFGSSDALVIAVFLLLVLKREQVMVSPAPFAFDAPYFRNALVRACFSDAGVGVREEPRHIGMFLENLFAGGAHRLRLSDTECREYRGLEASSIVGSRRGNYLLRIGDMPIASLRFGRSRTGDVSMEALEVDPRYRHLMPLNLLRSCDAIELERFVKSRVMSRGRAYRGEILGACGISGARTWAIVHSSRGVCATDAYSIVHEGDDTPFSVCGMLEGALDETLQEVALTGKPVKAGKRGDAPLVLAELATGGRTPKAWRRMDDGGLALYKAAPISGGQTGSAAIRAVSQGIEAGDALLGGMSSREASSMALRADLHSDVPGARHVALEILASQVARALGAGAVSYEEGEWFGLPCSVCRNFATREVSFVPFALAVTRCELDDASLDSVLGFYRTIGAEAARAFRMMLVLDCLLANSARTHLDHGAMRDASSGEVLAAAPIFDLDEALFAARPVDADATPDELASRALDMKGLFKGISLGDQARFALSGAFGEAADSVRELLDRAMTFDPDDFDAPDFAAEKALHSIPLIAARILENE